MSSQKKTRYIFVMGGVLSGLGKGIATSSIGTLLTYSGYNVTALKIDPYINVDAGTMNPTEHGEVFVTKDGLETDQDIGNYERFLDKEMTKDNYMTQGMVWSSVIEKERNLEYGGITVQPFKHIAEEIINRIKHLGKVSKADFVLIEIGGTVGEYENLIFLEAARRMRIETPDSVRHIMVSYLPIPAMVGEMKTKPTQTAVNTLNAAGIQPDFILTRSSKPLDKKRKEKISYYCNVPAGHVISSEDVESIYKVPLLYQDQKFDELIQKSFGMRPKKSALGEWNKTLVKSGKNNKTINIAMIGKYFATGEFTLSDSYISVIEALKSAGIHQKVDVEFTWVSSEDFEKNKKKLSYLDQFDGIVVPGGFGSRGVEGIIAAIGYARKNNIPYLGLCYGMQLATIEFARNVAGIKEAHTTEIKPKAKHPVIDVMNDQKKLIAENRYGGTMRLGDYSCALKAGTHARRLYKKKDIVERHRHRYEFNNKYRDKLEKAGLIIAGLNTKRDLVEIIELPDHPYFVGVQFHPEFKSRPMRPHPVFTGLIEAAKNKHS
ncbi:MAG: CTP synthase [Patescibacteria group bacterium]